MRVQAWGAGAGSSGVLPLGLGSGGAGAYAAGTLAVAPGVAYTVVVGRGGRSDNNPVIATPYGFGGKSPGLYNGSDGGGLAGLFSGNSPVVATDSGRALIVAGGGGGGEMAASDDLSTLYNLSSGGQGGDGFSGGQPDMRGGNSTTPRINFIGGGGGGGGGCQGGRSDQTRLTYLNSHMAEGGTSCLAPSVIQGVMEFTTGLQNTNFSPSFTTTTAFMPPQVNDVHYAAFSDPAYPVDRRPGAGGANKGVAPYSYDGGHGLVVIQTSTKSLAAPAAVPTLSPWVLGALTLVLAAAPGLWRRRIGPGR